MSGIFFYLKESDIPWAQATVKKKVVRNEDFPSVSALIDLPVA
jgi:hypothetical protein